MSNAAVVVPINEAELETRALSIPEQAEAIEVHDQSGYERAAEFLRDVIASMRREIEETFSDAIRKANELHKELCGQRNRHLAPVARAEAVLKQRIGTYELEQRRKQQESERIAREEQQRLADELLEAQLLEVEAQGATAEEVRAIIETPVAAPKPFVSPTLNRVAGVTTRQTFKAEVVDLKKLCLAVAEGRVPLSYVEANMSALNAAARAQGSELARYVPGVRAVTESSVATRRNK